ncbi:hypothetical protein [Anaerostipes rhamnosivorans]|uniref:Uncharacterized protein n=1 Tax=Anaerostipes rhamnosivorans TaxID=1229621 RepID=A0A4P8IER2_9FIRM|nr:hypothetical protein [Anaerostipes rhamnosivorans]QCP36278.1 hypothetical protein AR1Y2_2824 [Anaerostipes rhamnosivorans]
MKRKWFVFLLAFVMCTGQTMIFAESDTGQEEKVTGKVESIEQTDLENEAQIEPQKLKKEEIGGGGRKNRNICSARKEKEKEDS